jgi:hypothetical protein
MVQQVLAPHLMALLVVAVTSEALRGLAERQVLHSLLQVELGQVLLAVAVAVQVQQVPRLLAELV